MNEIIITTVCDIKLGIPSQILTHTVEAISSITILAVTAKGAHTVCTDSIGVTAVPVFALVYVHTAVPFPVVASLTFTLIRSAGIHTEFRLGTPCSCRMGRLQRAFIDVWNHLGKHIYCKSSHACKIIVHFEHRSA